MAKIKWRHRRTGTIYKKVKFFDNVPNLAEVTTKAGSTYLVNRRMLEAVK